MEMNETAQEQEPAGVDEAAKAAKSGNIFSRHKVWWLVLVILCLLFSIVLPSEHARPGLIWAEVLGRTAGMLLGAYLLTGVVWLVSLMARSRIASKQFMACTTAVVACSAGAQIFLAVYRVSPTGNKLAPPNSGLPGGTSGTMNSVVRLHRQAFPNDQRTDDQITLDYAEHDPAFWNFQDAVRDYTHITGMWTAPISEPVTNDVLKVTPKE